VGPQGADKALHFAVYFVLGALCVPLVTQSDRPLRSGLLALVALLAFAVFDEFHQVVIPGRHGSFADWLADSAGAAAGMAMALIPSLRRKFSS
jgi:VanZ family protein